jgi:hypothetical protein
MQTSDWLEGQFGSIESAVQMLNEDFCWDINIVEIQKQFIVKSGETMIFSCKSHQELEAFLYGMGLSIKGVPEPYFSHLSKVMREWCDSL